MSGNSFIVPPLSWAKIESEAFDWRSALKVVSDPFAPIMEIIEDVMDQKLDILKLLVGEQSEMGTAEGYTDPSGKFIMLREDVYRGACNGEPRDRFTAAHEFGHWVLHTNIPLARAKAGQKVEAFRLSEPQANQFASEFLMPRQFFRQRDKPADVMTRHGVSYAAAEARLDYLTRKGLL